MPVVISKGNTKIGNIPNVSLPPGKSCIKNAPCSRKCYAKKAYRLYKTARQAWDNNWDILTQNREQYFLDINDYLTKHPSKYFRWHVAGDILDAAYFDHMVKTAQDFEDTLFLAYTKNHDTVLAYALEKDIPDNLSVYLSMWLGWGEHLVDSHDRSFFPFAWYQTKNNEEDRPHTTTFVCPGKCADCKHCWHSHADVIFMEH